MNSTIIIILVALIVIVAIAIVFVLIKGKDSSEDSGDSEMSFRERHEAASQQEDDAPPQQPQMNSPQLHTQQSPVQDLTTPQPMTQEMENEEADTPIQTPVDNTMQQMSTANPMAQQDAAVQAPVDNSMQQMNTANPMAQQDAPVQPPVDDSMQQINTANPMAQQDTPIQAPMDNDIQQTTTPQTLDQPTGQNPIQAQQVPMQNTSVPSSDDSLYNPNPLPDANKMNDDLAKLTENINNQVEQTPSPQPTTSTEENVVPEQTVEVSPADQGVIGGFQAPAVESSLEDAYPQPEQNTTPPTTQGNVPSPPQANPQPQSQPPPQGV